MASASGGLWKTTSGGVEWTPIFDDQGSDSIGTVVPDPNNPDVLLASSHQRRRRTGITASTRAHLFEPQSAASYESHLGVYRPSAAQHFRASNPAYGAPLTFWVSPAAPFDGQLALVVREAGSGDEVRRIELEDFAGGLGRVTWDVTRTVERPEEERGGRGGDSREVPVEEGRFEAALVHVTAAGEEVLTPWRGLAVDPLVVLR